MEMALGVLVVAVAGLIMGSSLWTMKLLRLFQFEQWWFIGALVGLFIIPWTITFALFPNAVQAFRDVPLSVLLISNAFSISWGIANILCGLCYFRIGVALTMAILTGLGVSVAAIMPLVFKGSGLFKNAPDLTSPAGLSVLCGIGVMLIGVVLACAGRFRPRSGAQEASKDRGSFLVGLIMTIIAGVTSAGLMLAFVYSQGPIVARVSVVENGRKIGLTVSDDKAMSGEYMVAADGSIVLKGKQDIGPIKVGGMTAKAASDTIAEKLGLAQSEADPKVSVDARNIHGHSSRAGRRTIRRRAAQRALSRLPHDAEEIVGRVDAVWEGLRPGGHRAALECVWPWLWPTRECCCSECLAHRWGRASSRPCKSWADKDSASSAESGAACTASRGGRCIWPLRF